MPNANTPVYLGSRAETRAVTERIANAILLSAAADQSDLEILDLVNSADSYSEAVLLARTAAGAYNGGIPSFPEGPDTPPDVAFVFDSWNVTFSEPVINELSAIREERDEIVDQLLDEEFEAYIVALAVDYTALRAIHASQLGLEDFDPTVLEYDVVEHVEGSIWRRIPLGPPALSQPTEENQIEPGGGSVTMGGADEGTPSAQLKMSSDSRAATFEGKSNYSTSLDPSAADIKDTDDRNLRSRTNGFGMNNSTWGPKMALTQLGADVDPFPSSPIPVTCSGTKISPRLIATAGHCLFKNGSWNSTRRFVPGADGLGQSQSGLDPSPNGFDDSQWRRVRGSWFDHEYSNYDFGLLVLYNSSPLRCWWWHGALENNSGLTQVGVHHYSYPGATQDCEGAGSPRGDDFCWASIYGDSRNIVREGGYRVYHYIDAQPGQSGGGYYRILDGDRYIVAVDRGCYTSVENDGVRLNSGNYDMIQDALSDYPASGC